MAKIIPFKGYRYDPSRLDIARVVAPPYDVISDEECELLYQSHPNNIVRLIKGKELAGDGPGENRYTRARQFLAEWISTGIIRQDEVPGIYVYEQQYKYSGGKPRIRRGFMALAHLGGQDSGAILGHEHTLLQPKQDRLNLMKECRANLSPIFSLYSEPEGCIDSILVETAFTPPALEFWDANNIRNKLWVINDPATIGTLIEQMRDKPIIIADGHHRYETALIYRQQQRDKGGMESEDAPHDYVLMMFVNLDGEGVTIYPVHRVIHDIVDFNPDKFRRELEDYFEITPFFPDSSDCEEIAMSLSTRMAESGDDRHVFGLYLGGERFEILMARDNNRLRALVEEGHCESFKALDVSIAQAIVLRSILGIGAENISNEEHLRYTPSGKTALEMVRNGESQIALLLNPTRPDQVRTVTYEGEKMPQKSTYFFPKLLSGLLINRFDT